MTNVSVPSSLCMKPYVLSFFFMMPFSTSFLGAVDFVKCVVVLSPCLLAGLLSFLCGLVATHVLLSDGAAASAAASTGLSGVPLVLGHVGGGSGGWAGMEAGAIGASRCSGRCAGAVLLVVRMPTALACSSPMLKFIMPPSRSFASESTCTVPFK